MATVQELLEPPISGEASSDRVIYDTSSGRLYYDADGDGSGAAELVATLRDQPLLTATKLLVS